MLKHQNRQALEHALEQAASGQRIGYDDALALYRDAGLLQLAKLARQAKEARSGSYVYFNVNRHINLTNICRARCPLCAFGRDAGQEDAFALTEADVENLVKRALAEAPELTEIHMVSALHPDFPFPYYVDMIRLVRALLPAAHIKAFTPVEIAHFSQLSGKTAEQVLAVLKEAGLNSLPGGGAEILDDAVRGRICPKKATAAEWIEVVRAAHRLQIPTNATMLYGHVETVEQRLRHLLTLRELQDETGGFQAFVAFPFHPANTGLANVPRVSAWEDLKMIALARLILDNFDHIKSFWMMLTPPVAQLSLAFGVDDLDGTVVEEKIIHAAGAATERGVSKQDLVSWIKETGWTPVERDTFYRPRKIYNGE